MKNIGLIIFLLLTINIMALQPSDIMLQGFHWESHESPSWYKIIKNNSSFIKDMGIDMIWLPPSSKSAAVEGYLPNELYIQDSAYGDSWLLKETIRNLHKDDIKVIADIVINHRTGTKDWGDFTNPEWGTDSVCKDDEWGEATGSYDTGAGFHAARDIDHTRDYVRKSIVEWLHFMKDEMGYDGWRYDFVKGFSGEFINHYNWKTEPYFSVGEYWVDMSIHDPDRNRQQLVDWVDNTQGSSSVFDFTTKGLLQHAVKHYDYSKLRDRYGKPAGVIGWWPEKSVTFIDNHDTGPSTGGQGGQVHWPFPSEHILKGYAYILTHPGIPCVYWPHVFDWGEHNRAAIKRMIKIRKASGINYKSSVDIKRADSMYAAIIDNKVAVKIGRGDWNPGDGWNVEFSDHEIAIWGK